MRRFTGLLLLALLASACVPEARERMGTPPTTPDAGTQTSTPTPDAGAVADAGAGDDASTPMEYCGDQICNDNESCASCVADCGACACDPGFILHEGRCAPESGEPFVSRLESEVCERWRTDFVSDVGTEWEATFGSTDPCDPGVVSEAAIANAIKRTNLYRWVAGMGRVDEDPTRRDVQQACAAVLFGIGGLTHEPPTDAPCYTDDGSAGAGSSNLAQAGGGLARSVDLYVGDGGVDSLGHRRWVLNPPMVQTTFGYKPPFSCMYAFSRGTNTPVEVHAWPPPGYVPAQAARGVWSFLMPSMDLVAETTTVELDINGGGFVPVTSWVVGGGFGAGPVLAWEPPAGTWSAGTVVRVRLSNGPGQMYQYTVVFSDC